MAVSSVTLACNKTSPQPTGTAHVLTATQSGGSNPTYRFYVAWRENSSIPNDQAVWTVIRDWTTGDNTADWTPSTAGVYQLHVQCCEAGEETDPNVRKTANIYGHEITSSGGTTTTGTEYGQVVEIEAPGAMYLYYSDRFCGCRFVAPHTGNITRIEMPWRIDAGHSGTGTNGYGVDGDGRFTFYILQDTNATTHLPANSPMPPTSYVAKSASLVPCTNLSYGGGGAPQQDHRYAQPMDEYWDNITFTTPSSGASVVAGQAYFLIWHNTHPSAGPTCWSMHNSSATRPDTWPNAFIAGCMRTMAKYGSSASWQPWSPSGAENAFNASGDEFGVNAGYQSVVFHYSDGWNGCAEGGSAIWTCTKSYPSKITDIQRDGMYFRWTNPTTTIDIIGSSWSKTGTPGTLYWNIENVTDGGIVRGQLATAAEETQLHQTFFYANISSTRLSGSGSYTFTNGKYYRVYFDSPSSNSSNYWTQNTSYGYIDAYKWLGSTGGMVCQRNTGSGWYNRFSGGTDYHMVLSLQTESSTTPQIYYGTASCLCGSNVTVTGDLPVIPGYFEGFGKLSNVLPGSTPLVLHRGWPVVYLNEATNTFGLLDGSATFGGVAVVITAGVLSAKLGSTNLVTAASLSVRGVHARYGQASLPATATVSAIRKIIRGGIGTLAGVATFFVSQSSAKLGRAVLTSYADVAVITDKSYLIVVWPERSRLFVSAQTGDIRYGTVGLLVTATLTSGVSSPREGAVTLVAATTVSTTGLAIRSAFATQSLLSETTVTVEATYTKSDSIDLSASATVSTVAHVLDTDLTTVYISNVNVGQYVRIRSLAMNWGLNERTTCAFMLQLPLNVPVPAIGEPVFVTTGESVVFTGSIDRLEEEIPGQGHGGVRFVSVSCADDTLLCDRHLVARIYEGKDARYIINDIVTNDLSGEGISPYYVLPGWYGVNPTIDKAVFNYQSVTDCFNDLADLIGCVWYIDTAKKLHFVSNEMYTAPFAIEEGVYAPIRDIKVTKTREQYRNRQYVSVRYAFTPERVETIKPGDFETKTFTLAYPLMEAPRRIRVNGVEETIGRLEVDTGRDWYWSPDSNTITQDEDEFHPPLTPFDTLQVTYRGTYPINLVREDAVEIAARAAIEGGTGVYESIERDNRIETVSQGQTTADALLRRYGSIPVTVSFQIRVAGLRPGQLITIDLPTYNVSGQYLVGEVTAEDVDGQYLVYTVTLLSGEHLGGWVDFFRRVFGVEKRLNRQYLLNESDLLFVTKAMSETIVVDDSDLVIVLPTEVGLTFNGDSEFNGTKELS